MIDPTDLVFGKHYVAEVAHNEHNPIHRVILSSYSPEARACYLWNAGYYRPMHARIEDLAYLKVLKEIPELDESPYDLPADRKAKEAS